MEEEKDIKRIIDFRKLGISMEVLGNVYECTPWYLRARGVHIYRHKFSHKKVLKELIGRSYKSDNRGWYYTSKTRRDEKLEMCLEYYGYRFRSYERSSDFKLITLLLTPREKLMYEHFRRESECWYNEGRNVRRDKFGNIIRR